MKRLINCSGLAILFLFTSLALMACSDDDPVGEMTEVQTPPGGDGGGSSGEVDDDDNDPMDRNITISANGISFSATLEDNEAARAFAGLLPLTLDMSEMNGNEKYHCLDGSLPAESFRPGAIRTGDLMLYGSSCVVLFYETFSSGYSYTRLGRIDNPEGLSAALGSGDVTVRFEVQ